METGPPLFRSLLQVRPCFGLADRLKCPMFKLIDEFRRGWQGTSQPSPFSSIGFAACCLVLSTGARWCLALIRPDVFFTPYLPAVFFATALGGFRIGIVTALAGGALGVTLNFGPSTADSARFALMAIFWMVCGLTIWGVEHYRSVVAQQRQISKRLIQEEEYRKLLIEELQHRPQTWASIDPRIRALSATDDLIARVDGSGCDIKDMLLSELGPYDHVRFTLNGDPLFLPAKLAVSLALIFHELATNAGKYGAFSSPRGLLQVSWSVTGDRLNIAWGETEGPPVGAVGKAGFGTRLLNSALRPFDGKTEIAFLKSGVHCTMQCRMPRS